MGRTGGDGHRRIDPADRGRQIDGLTGAAVGHADARKARCRRGRRGRDRQRHRRCAGRPAGTRRRIGEAVRAIVTRRWRIGYDRAGNTDHAVGRTGGDGHRRIDPADRGRQIDGLTGAAVGHADARKARCRRGRRGRDRQRHRRCAGRPAGTRRRIGEAVRAIVTRRWRIGYDRAGNTDHAVGRTGGDGHRRIDPADRGRQIDGSARAVVGHADAGTVRRRRGCGRRDRQRQGRWARRPAWTRRRIGEAVRPIVGWRRRIGDDRAGHSDRAMGRSRRNRDRRIDAADRARQIDGRAGAVIGHADA